MIYLYLKQHNVTGLKYLGQTSKSNPYRYNGSGKYWLRHIKVHGNNVTTRILRECNTKEEIKQWGLIYSKLFNIVESKDFANFIPECGSGGLTIPLRGEFNGFFGKKHSNEQIKQWKEMKSGIKNPMYGKTHTSETKEKLRQINLGRKVSNETRQKISKSGMGNKNCLGRIMSIETRRKISQTKLSKI